MDAVKTIAHRLLVEAIDALARPLFWLIHYKPRS